MNISTTVRSIALEDDSSSDEKNNNWIIF
jgi:hypothetical protein